MLKLKAKTIDGEVVNFEVDELLGKGNRIDGVFHLEEDFGESVCLINTIELDKDEAIKLNPMEKSRTYIFPNNEKIILKNVEELKVSDSGNHRLKTSDGKFHIIPTGWLHIEIDTEGWTV